MKKICFSVLFMTFFFSLPFYAQKVSEKKDVAVFATLYEDLYTSSEFIAMIDEAIMDVFFSLERFNIIGLEYRLTTEDADAFTEVILKSREENVSIPEDVLRGLEAFTREDWEKLVNSYYVAVPVVKNISIKKEKYNDLFLGEIDGFCVKFTAKFTVYSPKEDLKEEFLVGIESASYSYEKACKAAASSLSDKLDLELRKIEAFKIKTGIIKSEKNTITFELGKKMGVKLGDEYVVLNEDGKKETGLIVVTKTENDFSEGLILYSKNPLKLGDPIKEVPHGPFEYRAYALGEIGVFSLENGLYDAGGTFGLHISGTRGFYRFRPCFGTEMTIDTHFPKLLSLGAPITIFAGAEIGNTYLRRLQILPTVQFYYTMIITGSKEKIPLPGGAGLRAFVHASFLVTKNFKIGGDAGVKIGSTFHDGIGGILRFTAGVGFTIKL
ncbi:hypothetical protein E4O03_00810 [Treponema sp. OMZ 792]|uniref:hypothetical protein n=1 Tax=unclassified Treponema TaxID=2638727 RepID=UPI0020A31F41|nr:MULTISPECIES: hypothetical protein [unclassified Treponema]UTC75302.1 hypothetical protein E4O03_00810 [Treponema sp. OMZ 792]UTC78907.1 hypothetical protein E4O04_13215 [Treponema sp. OMZ 799]UTC79304.1 hypothetical protein E4O07_00820 [Treponema sp. OMZ 798]